MPSAPISRSWAVDFSRRHRLPPAFQKTAEQHFDPLMERLAATDTTNRPLAVGINGAQGTGKSTLADYLVCGLGELHGRRAVALSIDDFYLTRAERGSLAKRVHPLLETRGVPGTHDTDLLSETLSALIQRADPVMIPRFDKVADERHPATKWTAVDGGVDVVLLEGWCVGATPQTASELEHPINSLETTDDAAGIWRRFVNESLTLYQPAFAQLGLLVFLQPPDAEAILRWRLLQETKLQANAGSSEAVDPAAMARFISHFERLTQHCLREMPERADVIMRLDQEHRVVESTYRK